MFVIPPFGALVLFWRPGRLRALPCPDEWGMMDDDQRADYAPCGYYHGGRIRKGGHQHWDTGLCGEARFRPRKLALERQIFRTAGTFTQDGG